MDSKLVKDKEVKDINPSDESIFRPLNTIYLGHGVATLCETLTLKYFSSRQFQPSKLYRSQWEQFWAENKDIRNVFSDCRNFLISAAVGIKRRYDFGDPVMKSLRILDPAHALSSSRVASIASLAKAVPRIIGSDLSTLQALDDEWRALYRTQDVARKQDERDR